MKKLIISFVFVLIVNLTFNIDNCSAQWVQMPMSNKMGINEYLPTTYDQSVFSFAILGDNILAGTFNGVEFSTDNGNRWEQTNNLDFTKVTSFVVSGDNIFAGTSNDGVYISTNNGMSWTQCGLNNKTVCELVVLGNNIFAGTVRTNASTGGLYLSTNDGSSWTKTFLSAEYIYSLAVSENNIFAGTSYGVYLSTNNGTNWKASLNIADVSSFAVSGNNIFAGIDNTNRSGSGGVWLSTNNGTSWIEKNQGFSGIYNKPTICALIITNNYVFAGTSGYSVWRCSLEKILE